MKPETIIIQDEACKIEVSKWNGNIFISLQDEYGFSARTSFSDDQLDQLIEAIGKLRGFK